MEKQHIYDEQFKAMEERFTEVESTIESMDKKLTQVVDALLGNPLTNQGGFIRKIEELEVEVALLKKAQIQNDTFKNRIMWTIGIIIGGSTVVGITLKSLIELYITVRQSTP